MKVTPSRISIPVTIDLSGEEARNLAAILTSQLRGGPFSLDKFAFAAQLKLALSAAGVQAEAEADSQ